jgi:hypothetical protein
MGQTTGKYQLIANFLYRLEREGYPLGVGTHIRAQELLARLPDDIPLDQLHSYLVPIFARSGVEQERFRGYFNDALEFVEVMNRPTPPQKRFRIRSKYLKAALAIATLILLPLLYISIEQMLHEDKNEYKGPTEWVVDFKVEEGTKTNHICVDDGIEGFGKVIGKADAEGLIESDGDYGYGEYSMKGNCLVFDASNVLGIADTIEVEMRNIINRTITVKFVPEITGQEEIVVQPIPGMKQMLQKSLPFPESVDNITLPPPSPWAVFYDQWQKLFITGYWILAGILIWLMHKWRNERRTHREKHLVAELETKDSPPYVWNLRLENKGDLTLDDEAGMTLRKLRERAKDDIEQFSITETIAKTIQKGGRFSPQFEALTKPAEYLMLIERSNANDHRAKLYDSIFKIFQSNEVFVERYFFDADVRVCFSEEYRNGIKLSELSKKYSGIRLIIIGTGHSLLNPMSGRLAKWAQIFEDWPQRAIMTPKPMDSWTRRENRLGEMFTVLPAHHKALAYWVDSLKNGVQRDFDTWLKQLPDAQTISVRFDGDTVATLRKYFNEPYLQWIAACAVYPALYWDLTVHLGNIIEEELGEDDIVSISGLSDIYPQCR